MARFNNRELNDKLINHYVCFNTERFYLDEDNIEEGFISIVSSSIQDPCPVRLCRGIARFIKKNIEPDKYNLIFVGPWGWKVNDL